MFDVLSADVRLAARSLVKRPFVIVAAASAAVPARRAGNVTPATALRME